MGKLASAAHWARIQPGLGISRTWRSRVVRFVQAYMEGVCDLIGSKMGSSVAGV